MVAHAYSYDYLGFGRLAARMVKVGLDGDPRHATGDPGGTGEALLMAVAGRHGVVAELSGPGAAMLADRIGG